MPLNYIIQLAVASDPRKTLEISTSKAPRLRRRMSSNLTAMTLDFVALMCSIPILSSGIWLASKPGDDCIHWIRWPLLYIGISFLVVSLTRFLDAYRKKEGLLGLYLVCMAMIIVVLLVLLVLAFVVTRPDGAYSIPQVGFREYKL